MPVLNSKTTDMKYLFFSLVLACMLIDSPLQAQTNSKWTLIYENDEVGKVLQGSKENLIEAIRNGQEVRISWLHESPVNPTRKVEHLANAKFMTIMSDKTVFAQIDPIVGQSPDFDEQIITLKENLEWSMIASSSGLNDHMTRNLISGEIVSHGSSRWGIKWFIKK